MGALCEAVSTDSISTQYGDVSPESREGLMAEWESLENALSEAEQRDDAFPLEIFDRRELDKKITDGNRAIKSLENRAP